MNRPCQLSLRLPRSLLKRIRQQRKISPAAHLLNLVITDLERARRRGQL